MTAPGPACCVLLVFLAVGPTLTGCDRELGRQNRARLEPLFGVSEIAELAKNAAKPHG